MLPSGVLWIDHLLAVALVVVGPLRSGTMGLRRLEKAEASRLSDERISVYTTATILQWGLSLTVVGLWLGARRSFGSLGLAPRLTGGLIGTALGFAVVVIALVRQRRRVLTDPDDLATVREKLQRLVLLLPHTAAEFRAFVGLAVTAGVCEELLYRGYLMWYFGHVAPWWLAWAVAAIAFGLGHAYQGSRGVLLTASVGAFFGGVYLLSRSLYLPMLMHALMDLHSGHLAWRAYEREREERAAIAAPPPMEPPA